jgi:hypothetical protein
MDASPEFPIHFLKIYSYPLETLELFAQYFYRREDFHEALRTLDILLTRGNLSEEQRRSFKRLWTVIRQKQEAQ